jgi:hypothetical protein
MKTTNGNLQTTSSSSLLNIRLQQLLLLLLLLLLCSICDAIHIKSSCPPDAFQSAPLKVPEDGLPFCSAYRDLACCAAEDTLQIQKTVLSMMKKECRSCFSMVSEWKCAECDPDAGECIFPKSNNKQTTNDPSDDVLLFLTSSYYLFQKVVSITMLNRVNTTPGCVFVQTIAKRCLKRVKIFHFQSVSCQMWKRTNISSSSHSRTPLCSYTCIIQEAFHSTSTTNPVWLPKTFARTSSVQSPIASRDGYRARWTKNANVPITLATCHKRSNRRRSRLERTQVINLLVFTTKQHQYQIIPLPPSPLLLSLLLLLLLHKFMLKYQQNSNVCCAGRLRCCRWRRWLAIDGDHGQANCRETNADAIG